jgi:hypothetical protein
MVAPYQRTAGAPVVSAAVGAVVQPVIPTRPPNGFDFNQAAAPGKKIGNHIHFPSINLPVVLLSLMFFSLSFPSNALAGALFSCHRRH